ncbi:TIGR02611 family protein [Actinomycetes bacterium KLBMP 9797]
MVETTASSSLPPRPPERPRWRDRIHTTLEIIRANPTGRIALKVFIAVAGLLVVALGVLLIPLPGPGWLIVIGGLAIWAVEFSWARKLLTFTRRNVRAWTHWVTRQSLPVRFLLGAVGLVFVGAVVVLTVRLSFGVNLITTVLDYFAAR